MEEWHVGSGAAGCCAGAVKLFQAPVAAGRDPVVWLAVAGSG